jgi:ABC-type glutathione transport system ATPase component
VFSLCFLLVLRRLGLITIRLMCCNNLLRLLLARICAFPIRISILTMQSLIVARPPCLSLRNHRSHRRSPSEMIVTRTLTSTQTSGSRCTSRLLQRCYLSPGYLTSNVRRRVSTCSSAGMDFPAGLRHPQAEEPIVNVGRNSAVYPLGASASPQRTTPSLRFEDCEMVVEEGQAWVVVGTSGAGKDVLLQVSGKYRCGC